MATTLSRDIHSIASDYFGGRITPEDRQWLDQWLAESEENRKVLAELERVWRITGRLASNVEVDTAEEWKRFTAMRNGNSSQRVLGPLAINPFFLRIAAITLPAVLAITLAVYFYRGSTEWESVTSGNTTTRIGLPDGSHVHLNSHSTLEYPGRFARNERQVRLNGEAFFDVARNGASFVVKAGDARIEVLGTRFNVMAKGTSTPIEVYVDEGKVLLASNSNPGNRVVLTANQKGKLANPVNPIIVEASANPNTHSWHTRRLVFNNAPLTMVANDLELFFGKQVVVAPALSNSLFTGEFDNPEEQNALAIVAETIGCSYRVVGNTVYFESIPGNK
jgi:ferric-dicitrate binding protein FerR (iron transport regulator)